MFFKPRWYKAISKGILLSNNQINELKKLRKELNFISEDDFIQIIVSSSVFGAMIIRRDYHNYKSKYPSATEREVLQALFLHEIEAMQVYGSLQFISEEEINQIFEKIDSLNGFIKFVNDIENQQEYQTNSISIRIDSILNQQ